MYIFLCVSPKLIVLGVLLWLSGLRTWRCRCCGSGYSYGKGLTPGVGISAFLAEAKQNKTKQNKNLVLKGKDGILSGSK